MTNKEYNQLLKTKGYEQREHQKHFLTSNEFDNSRKPFVLAAGTSAGKGPMSIMWLEGFYSNPNNKNKKTLFVAASKTILRDNIHSVLKAFKPSFSYSIVKDKKTLISALERNAQVLVLIPQTIKNYYKLLPKIHNFILDEAHEWYFAKKKNNKESSLDKIIEHIQPKKQLLLTGTPSKFNANADKYNFQYVPVMDLYDEGLVSNVKIEIVSSIYDFKSNDWLGTYGNLKQNKTNSAKQAEESLVAVCNEMINKLKNPLKDWYNINNVTKHSIGKLFKYMDKTIIYTHSKKQANKFYEILNSKKELSGKVLLSHSENDKDSIEFNKFKTDSKYHILVAVDRGRIGFDMPELFNIVDFTLTQNLDVLLQMYGRLLRLSNNQSKKQKIYFKVATKNTADYFVDLMTAMLCLTNIEWYSKYNGKNMGGIIIPKVLTKSIRNKTYTNNNQTKKKSTSVKPYVSLTELGIPLDINFFRQSILHTSNSKFNTIAETTLDDVRKEIFKIDYRGRNIVWASYEEAKKFIHTLGLQSQNEYNEYVKLRNFPDNIPYSVGVYKRNNTWISWQDYLGHGKLSSFEVSDRHLSYNKAKKYIKQFKFKSFPDYKKHVMENNINFLPLSPKSKYKNTGEWKGYSDFFGVSVIANQDKKYWDYEKAKKFVHKLRLNNREEWIEYKKSGKMPLELAKDSCVYKNDWKGWGDFLGNGKPKGWQKIKGYKK